MCLRASDPTLVLYCRRIDNVQHLMIARRMLSLCPTPLRGRRCQLSHLGEWPLVQWHVPPFVRVNHSPPGANYGRDIAFSTRVDKQHK